MKVLGHYSVSMALIYAQISDQEVLRDYKSVLAPGAVIAGPAALDLKSGVLPDDAVHWLKTNFFKTELELGHCLRLPAEGPCECDLYLTCAKFVTTADFAPDYGHDVRWSKPWPSTRRPRLGTGSRTPALHREPHQKTARRSRRNARRADPRHLGRCRLILPQR
jgi:hypothetical protein